MAIIRGYSTLEYDGRYAAWFKTVSELENVGCIREGSIWIGEPNSNEVSAAHDDDRHFLPLYEAKMIHQFDHRWATYQGEQSRDTTLVEKLDCGFEPTPRYWVPKTEVKRASQTWAGVGGGSLVGATSRMRQMSEPAFSLPSLARPLGTPLHYYLSMLNPE